MKPLGMDPLFRIVKPTRAQDAIYNAVEEAIDAGMSVEQFRREAAECWSVRLDEMKHDANRAWSK